MLTSNSSSKLKQTKKAVVIGSGFGGLAAAIRLQAMGVQTTIFEKRDQPGGRAYVYRDKGFTFDAGPTVITAPPCLEELFELAGRQMKDYVELLPVTPFYRLFWEDGKKFDYCSDMKSTLEQIAEFSEKDGDGYQRFLKYSKEVFDEGYTKLAAEPFLDWWSMIRAGPKLVKLKAYKSVYAVVASFIESKHLRQAFSFHSLLVGGNPFATSSIYTLIHYLERNWGVSFPRGGTGALVKSLVKIFEEMGGQIRLDSELKQILVENERVVGVETKSGEQFKAEIVVSNADVVHTYQNLLSKTTSAAPKAKRLKSMRQSMSLFLIYFGTNKKYPEIAHHNVIFGPRYKELLTDIFSKGVLPGDFSLYLHAPTKSDPSLAPDGHEGFYVLSPVAHLGKLKIDWKVEGPKYADKILSYLEKHCLPGLKEAIVTQRIFTPDDFKTELNAFQGSAFSLEPVLTQSAFFRTHNRDSSIEGLYFVGAGTHPGAGIPGVVNSAKATSKVIAEDLGFSRSEISTETKATESYA